MENKINSERDSMVDSAFRTLCRNAVKMLVFFLLVNYAGTIGMTLDESR